MAISGKNAKFAKIAAVIAAGCCGAALLPFGAWAQDANRCEGTLCDLYYSSRGEPPKTASAQPTAPTPTTTGTVPPGATVLTTPSSGGLLGWFKPSPSAIPPSEPASASNSYMHLGGGGVLGGSTERCSGTVCDLYYHGSPEPAEGQRQASATAMAAPAEPPIVHRHIVHESETRPKCSSPAADPWHCFR